MATAGSSDSDTYSEGEEMSTPGPSSNKKSKKDTNVKVEGDVTVRGDVTVGSLQTSSMVMNNFVYMSTGATPLFRPSSQTDFQDEALIEPEPFDDWAQTFAQKDLDRDVEDRYLAPISKCINEERFCRWLARKLDVDNPTLMSFKDKHRDDLPELAYQLLRKWKQTKGQVTIKDLLNVLYMSRNTDAIRKLEEVLRRNREDAQETRSSHRR